MFSIEGNVAASRTSTRHTTTSTNSLASSKRLAMAKERVDHDKVHSKHLSISTSDSISKSSETRETYFNSYHCLQLVVFLF